MRICRSVAVAAFLAVAAFAGAQAPPDPDYVRRPVYDTFADFRAELDAISATADAAARTARLDALWGVLREAGQTPFAVGDRAALLYRGEATSVAFAGDFSSWNPSAASRVAGTDLWVRELPLPSDARVDYKVVLNGGDWRLDPSNPLEMWSGFGPNSELRMPDYAYPHEAIRRPDALRGRLTGNIRTQSAALGYAVQHRVYLPAEYLTLGLSDLPVVYVTDGHEYSADHLGSLVATLDNLVSDRSIRPVIAVFIDPRDPDNPATNRRMQQYVENPAFVRYLADELAPRIDGAYRTSPRASDRAVLGTSLGGLVAAYVGALEGDVFGKIGIQSPAFGAAPSIYDRYRRPPANPLEVYMTAGTINDGSGGPTMEAIFQEFGYDHTYVESNEGHSWGNWRARLPDLLRALVGPPDRVAGDFNSDGLVDAADYTVWRDALGSTADSGAYRSWQIDYARGPAEAAPTAVPEPTTAAAVALVGVAAFTGRRP